MLINSNITYVLTNSTIADGSVDSQWQRFITLSRLLHGLQHDNINNYDKDGISINIC